MVALYRFVELVRVVPFDLTCARILGSVKSKLPKIGKPTGEIDAIIGAVVLAHRAELVTGNTRHFQNIEGLKLADWISEEQAGPADGE